MKNEIIVTAKDDSSAIAEALKIFKKELNREIMHDEVQVIKATEKSGFLGFNKRKEYTFRLLSVEGNEEQTNLQDSKLAFVQDLDGYFELKVKSDGIFLKVIAPKGNGRSVNLIAIKQMIEEKELVEVNYELVETSLVEATGEAVKIAERKPELDKDAELLVKISNDQMTAFCTYIPPHGGKKFTLETALNYISSKNVTYGIITEKVAELLNENIKQELRIAQGTPPIDGKDAELRFHFKLPEEKKRVKELEDGKVDFHNLDLVVSVKPGDLLVTKLPATPGTPGRSVSNEVVKSLPGKDVKLPKGKNVGIGADEMSLFATLEGQVFLEGDKVSVLPIFTVEGDVDLETGNIDFVGNVIVKGNVHEGFIIKAEGDIEVIGNVGGAVLEAGGSINVRKGFQGKQKGQIIAQGDVSVGFIENGQIKTKGNLVVKGAIMHSKIVAKLDITVEGRGLIVGGMVQAGGDINAKIIGSHLATPTEVLAGVDPEIRSAVEQVNTELDNADSNLDKVVKGIELLRKTEKQLGGLPQDKYAVLDQFESTRAHLQGQLNTLRQQREVLLKQLKEQKNGRIRVSDRIHPGVKINIGQVGYRVKDTLARCILIYEDGEIRPRPL